MPHRVRLRAGAGFSTVAGREGGRGREKGKGKREKNSGQRRAGAEAGSGQRTTDSGQRTAESGQRRTDSGLDGGIVDRLISSSGLGPAARSRRFLLGLAPARNLRSPSGSPSAERAVWVGVMRRLADPVLNNLADGTLKARMPVEQAAGADRRNGHASRGARPAARRHRAMARAAGRRHRGGPPARPSMRTSRAGRSRARSIRRRRTS